MIGYPTQEEIVRINKIDSFDFDVDINFTVSKKLVDDYDFTALNKVFDSTIIPETVMRNNLQDLLPNYQQFDLLYRMSRDGDISVFHQLCDGKGPTIAVFQTDSNKIFGGFTDIPWASEGKAKKGKSNSFIFMARNNKIDRFMSIKGMTEVYHDAN